jgi:putative SOS response-associated peptidase YedK
LIPISEFFEWQKLASGKQAFHIHRQDNRFFSFAGLWEHKQKILYSCTIITTEATEFMQPIHERHAGHHLTGALSAMA